MFGTAGSLPSVMKHDFSRVPSAEIQRSKFDRSHGYKTTFDAGYLIPVFWDEVLPGDTLHLNMQTFCRLATPIVPVMDNMYMESFFFFCPNRLVSDEFVKMMGEQENPDDETDFLTPQVPAPTTTGFASASLFDYFGLPIGKDGFSINAYLPRMYNLTWNQWFRDENLQDSVVVDKDAGPDDPDDYVLLRRGKRHDYFTSCLPWPQKGPDVLLPLGQRAPVRGIGKFNTTFPVSNQAVYETDRLTQDTYVNAALIYANNDNGTWYAQQDPATAGRPNIWADLSDATAATINALREAFQLQRLFERDARGGTRYTELIKAHFGVVSDDARLQRVEYLGGGSQPISFSPVPQTSVTATTPQGNLAAFAVSSGQSGFSKSFTEHGHVLGLVSVRADLNYQYGINRMWSRRTRYDFYWPALAHLGEQAVLKKELFYADNPTLDEDVWGYQERFAEYRYKPSLITGQFRSDHAQSLDVWHLAEELPSTPSLDDSYIVDNPPVDRVVAVTSNYPQFLFDGYFKYVCARPMPMYSVPGLIDHF